MYDNEDEELKKIIEWGDLVTLHCVGCGSQTLYHVDENGDPGDYYIGNPYGCSTCNMVFHLV